MHRRCWHCMNSLFLPRCRQERSERMCALLGFFLLSPRIQEFGLFKQGGGGTCAFRVLYSLRYWFHAFFSCGCFFSVRKASSFLAVVFGTANFYVLNTVALPRPRHIFSRRKMCVMFQCVHRHSPRTCKLRID